VRPEVPRRPVGLPPGAARPDDAAPGRRGGVPRVTADSARRARVADERLHRAGGDDALPGQGAGWVLTEAVPDDDAPGEGARGAGVERGLLQAEPLAPHNRIRAIR